MFARGWATEAHVSTACTLRRAPPFFTHALQTGFTNGTSRTDKSSSWVLLLVAVVIVSLCGMRSIMSSSCVLPSSTKQKNWSRQPNYHSSGSEFGQYYSCQRSHIDQVVGPVLVQGPEKVYWPCHIDQDSWFLEEWQISSLCIQRPFHQLVENCRWHGNRWRGLCKCSSRYMLFFFISCFVLWISEPKLGKR